MINFLRSLVTDIYRMQPQNLVIMILALSLCIYWFRAFCIMKRCWKKVAIVCFIIWYSIVLYITVVSREKGIIMQWKEIRPFYSYKMYFDGVESEALRSNMMNILLFIPGGFLMYDILHFIKNPLRIITIVCISLCISLSIENLQYYLKCGSVEIDDVINNCLGAIIYPVVSAVWKYKK